jgi:hypothetical protein
MCRAMTVMVVTVALLVSPRWTIRVPVALPAPLSWTIEETVALPMSLRPIPLGSVANLARLLYPLRPVPNSAAMPVSRRWTEEAIVALRVSRMWTEVVIVAAPVTSLWMVSVAQPMPLQPHQPGNVVKLARLLWRVMLDRTSAVLPVAR